MRVLLFLGLTRVLNKILRLDPEAPSLLAKQAGKVIHITVIGFPSSCFIRILPTSIELLAKYAGTVDLTMSSSLGGLLVASTRLFAGNRVTNLTLTGDMEVAQWLSDTLMRLDIDWEGVLANYLGDTVAQAMASVVTQLRDCGLTNCQRMRTNTTDYIQEEACWLPPKAELNDFYTDVAEMRDAVERLAAKIARLQTR